MPKRADVREERGCIAGGAMMRSLCIGRLIGSRESSMWLMGVFVRLAARSLLRDHWMIIGLYWKVNRYSRNE